MPIGTTYLASSAETVANYADTYVSFTTNLITSTFEALLQAHHSQVEAYAELVGTLSQGLSTYINETQDTITPAEIIEFISNLPLQQAALLEENQTVVYDGAPSGSTPTLGVQTTPEAGAPTTSSFASIAAELLNPTVSPGPALQVIESIKSLLKKPESIKTELVLNPYEKFENAADTDTKAKEVAFMDIVKTVISSNKYSLLENMVETGLLRLVVDRGLILTEFDMELTESYSDSAHSKQRTRVKNVGKAVYSQNMGVKSLFNRRGQVVRSGREKVLTVTNRKKSQSNDTSGTAQMRAKVEIHFSTDYKPLLLKND